MYTSTSTVNFLHKGQPHLLQTWDETETLWKHARLCVKTDRKKFGEALMGIMAHQKLVNLCMAFCAEGSLFTVLSVGNWWQPHMWYSISLCYTTFTLNESEHEHKIGMNYVLFFQNAQSTPFFNVNYEGTSQVHIFICIRVKANYFFDLCRCSI